MNCPARRRRIAPVPDNAKDANLENEIFRGIFNNASDGILVADSLTRRFLMANRSMSRMTGYSVDEICQMGIEDLHPKEAMPRVLEHFKRMVVDELALSEGMPMKRRDGSIFFVDVSAAIVKAGGKMLAVGFFRDVTERKASEDKLKKRIAELERPGSLGEA